MCVHMHAYACVRAYVSVCLCVCESIPTALHQHNSSVHAVNSDPVGKNAGAQLDSAHLLSRETEDKSTYQVLSSMSYKRTACSCFIGGLQNVLLGREILQRGEERTTCVCLCEFVRECMYVRAIVDARVSACAGVYLREYGRGSLYAWECACV